MSQCWPEGALRAHLDCELAPEEMERVSAHLGQCAECARLSAKLAGRAKRVGMWLESLPAALPVPATETVPAMKWVAPAPRRAAGRRWIGWAAGLSAALAAGLAVTSLILPSQHNAIVAPAPVVASALPVNVAVPVPELLVAVAVPAGTGALPTRIRRPRPLARTVSNEFLALDDEPIETGVVMRVGVEPGNVQADVVFGPDGRAHAIRLIGTRN